MFCIRWWLNIASISDLFIAQEEPFTVNANVSYAAVCQPARQPERDGMVLWDGQTSTQQESEMRDSLLVLSTEYRDNRSSCT